jgi:hypothetical protein
MKNWRQKIWYYLSRTKKTVIVDVNVVNSVMWLKRWGRGEGSQNQRVGQLLPDKGPEWIGICNHEQNIRLPSKFEGSFLSFTKGFS